LFSSFASGYRQQDLTCGFKLFYASSTLNNTPSSCETIAKFNWCLCQRKLFSSINLFFTYFIRITYLHISSLFHWTVSILTVSIHWIVFYFRRPTDYFIFKWLCSKTSVKCFIFNEPIWKKIKILKKMVATNNTDLGKVHDQWTKGVQDCTDWFNCLSKVQ
jgi:hypothetical protein